MNLFPDAETIGSIFRSFGPIVRVVKLSQAPLSVLIQFEHAGSAASLINANGLRLGDRILVTRSLTAASSPSTTLVDSPINNNHFMSASGMTRASSPPNLNSFDPFGENVNWTDQGGRIRLPITPQSLSRRPTRLNAESQPFIPSFDLKPAEFEPQMSPSRKLSFHNTGSTSNLPATPSPNKSDSPSWLSAKSHHSDMTVVSDR